MADYDKPVLQKPPGYRDPNMVNASPPPPPPPMSATPMRKPVTPMPSAFRPKRKRRNCCRFCCCCFCITLFLIIFLLLIGTAVFYLWYDPKLPSFNLSSFRLDNFKLSGDDPDSPALSATTVARVEMKNPNTKLVFYYGNTDVEMSVGSGKDETAMGKTNFAGFKQGPKNTTSVRLTSSVKDRVLDKGLAKRLATKYQSKELVINVVAKTKVGLGVGGIKIGMLAVNLRCGGVSLNKLDTESPKCTLNTLKWVNIVQ